MPTAHQSIDQVLTVRAGKFRRYHGEGFKQLLDIPTQLKNIRDLFYFVVGFFQSLRLLHKVQPDVVFIKGGFVGVPIGLAAAIRGIPYVTHDSDAIPGLANRIIAKWARFHAVAMPVENYQYPKAKTKQVGVPVNAAFAPISESQKQHLKEELHVPRDAPVLCITGGGLGALRLNHAIVHVMPLLLAHAPNLYVYHVAGPGKATSLQTLYQESLNPEILNQVEVFEFVDDLYRYSGVADVVITRAGANSLADFATQAKACIVVPNPQLTGGHQTKNAQALVAQGAVMVITEEQLAQDSSILASAIIELLDSPRSRKELETALSKTAQTDAAEKIARLVISTAESV